MTNRFVEDMSPSEQPAYLGSAAFWTFLAEQESDPVVRRLHEHFGKPQPASGGGCSEQAHPGS